jgi:hypothetical protein
VNNGFIIFDIAKRQNISYKDFADILYEYLIGSDEDEIPDEARAEYDEEIRQARSSGKPIWL